jgi:GcrA cell cycle regulator
MSWNDDNVSQLRNLWDQGLPTAQIGKLLGFTKNAVVGKAHRIGLERRPSPIRRTAVKPDRKKARSPVIPKLNFENNSNNSIEQKEIGITKKIFYPTVKNFFSTKTKRGCEWPEGHPDEPEFRFCGNERLGDKPYCLDHCAVAYVIPEKDENKINQNKVA